MSLEKDIQAILQTGKTSISESLAAVVFHGDKVKRIHVGKKYKYYDLASLTKILFTTSKVMNLVDHGKLDIDLPVQHYLPWFKESNMRVRQLLSHSSGLPWWIDLTAKLGKFKPGERWSKLKDVIAKCPIKVSEKAVYSDPDFWTLGFIIESLESRALYDVWQSMAKELKFKDLFFLNKNKVIGAKSLYAPTFNCEKKKPRKLVARVNDENTFLLGGVSSHAGLFGTLAAVEKWLNWIRDIYFGRVQSGYITSSTLRRFSERSMSSNQGDWGLGFMKPGHENPSCGRHFGGESFGHLGFPGTSIWFDPAQDLGVIILAHRKMKNAQDREFAKLRPALHDLLVDAAKSL